MENQTAWTDPVTRHHPNERPAQENSGDFVSVTVPVGVSGGETIHVLHPDQSGRVIEAVVPLGLKAGTKFFVQAPPRVATNLPTPTASAVSPLAESVSGPGAWHITPHAPMAVPSAPVASIGPATSPAVTAVPMPPPASHTLPSPSSIPPSFSGAFDDNFPAQYSPMNFGGAPLLSPLASPLSHNNDNLGMRLVKVVVPPGTMPGSTIHVQVPGENRLVAAQVPPNCTEFHIQYDPRETPTSSVMESPMAQPRSWTPTRQETKVLLVRVPRGTPPGSILHVQVPNEHGRLLEARVPPHVSEFYVSYVPQPPPATHMRPSNDGRGWESAILPFTGGIATGVAGGMVFDHFAHHR